MRKRFLCLLLGLLCLTALLPAHGRAADAADVRAIADGIVAWKKADNGSTADGFLLNDAFLALAGTTPGDWYPIGLSRLGVEDRYDAYLAVLRDQVEERYRQPGALSAAKATEWHRIALAVLAAGGDPTSFGTDGDGQPIDLIADGTYNRGRQTSLGRQGINGWIWGLIALDSMRYELPDDAFYTREDILLEILCRQLADGGFALSGTAADPDITAMAVQALAPYYNTETVYTYKRKSTDSECARRIRDVVDEALDCLSRLQLPTGDFQSWGTENVESTDQVVVALCCLGIDPLTDERFIKGGNTLLDGILRYRMDDGGFVHAYSYDPDNPTSLPDRSNSMAGEQTLYTMAALWRQSAGLRTLYDFRPEQSEALKERIAALESGIAALPDDASAASLEALLRDFYALPADERSYVRGYWRLSDAAAAAGLDVSRIADTTPVVEGPDDAQDDTVLLYFSDSDRAAVDALPDVLTSEQYVTVTALLDKLRQCEDFDGREAYLERLNEARSQIAAVQAEIDAINDEIREKLYPFEDVTLLDKPVVDALVARYDALSAYDKTKIERWEDVVKTQTKLDNLLRAIWIGAALCVAAASLALLLVRRVRRRRRRKAEEMEALAALYADEDDRTEGGG